MTDNLQSSEGFHWTYAVPEDKYLQQGDIIDASEELRDVFAKILPHFAKPAYQGFMVLTQSCDLVRRRSQSVCKAPYISLAPIRRLEDVLLKILFQAGIRPYKGSDEVFDQNAYGRAKELLRKLFNQNEQSLGLFYLHPDERVNIHEASVAFLRVVLSLRCDHYDVLLENRMGALSREFRPKLGWLAGNLYSRVGTKDWEQAEAKQMIDTYLPKVGQDWGESQPLFVIDSVVRKALGCSRGEIAEHRRGDIIEAISNHEIKSPRDIAMERIRDILEKSFPQIPAKRIEKVIGRLNSDEELGNTIKNG